MAIFELTEGLPEERNMVQQPFTAAGLAAKLTELYTLTDSLLIAEADAVAADFNDWVKSNFILDSYQANYLDGASVMTSKTWGHLFATAFLRRSAISMATPPVNPPPRRTKEVRKNMIGLITYNDNTRELDGELTIDISWMLL